MVRKLVCALFCLFPSFALSSDNASGCESGVFRLLTFPGRPMPDTITIQGALPGDVLINVVSLDGDGYDYTSSFLKNIIFSTRVNPMYAYVSQITGVNLANKKFIALVCRHPNLQQ